jgi:hypothetical protein
MEIAHFCAGARRCCRPHWYSVNDKTLQAVLTQIRQLNGNEAALPNEETDCRSASPRAYGERGARPFWSGLSCEIIMYFTVSAPRTMDNAAKGFPISSFRSTQRLMTAAAYGRDATALAPRFWIERNMVRGRGFEPLTPTVSR